MSETPATLARRAYDTLEPFHLVAYFNPGLKDAQQDLELDPQAFYVGARGAPFGEAAAPLVVSAFYNFSPNVIVPAWERAREAGLAEIDDRRYQMLDEQYRGILGDLADGIAPLLPAYRAITGDLPTSGRPLAAVWSATPIPEHPALALWWHLTVLREWRGDNHIAELVRHGLTGLEAGVFHEGELPDPGVKRRVMGRRLFQLTRGWSDAEWDSGIASLAARGLVEADGAAHRLTADGYDLYREIEAGTDATTGPAFGPGTAELIERTRPLIKAVIDAGVLPGSKKR